MKFAKLSLLFGKEDWTEEENIELIKSQLKELNTNEQINIDSLLSLLNLNQLDAAKSYFQSVLLKQQQKPEQPQKPLNSVPSSKIRKILPYFDMLSWFKCSDCHKFRMVEFEKVLNNQFSCTQCEFWSDQEQVWANSCSMVEDRSVTCIHPSPLAVNRLETKEVQQPPPPQPPQQQPLDKLPPPPKRARTTTSANKKHGETMIMAPPPMFPQPSSSNNTMFNFHNNLKMFDKFIEKASASLKRNACDPQEFVSLSKVIRDPSCSQTQALQAFRKMKSLLFFDQKLEEKLASFANSDD